MRGCRLRIIGALMLTLASTLGASTLLHASPERLSGDEDLRAPTSDPVAKLQKRIDQGEVKLEYNEVRGYLDSLLKALKIPVSSQVLVFSKTSLQSKLISAKTPRAVYFNDDVYVGWPPDTDALEVSAADSQKGAVFYMLPQREEGPHRLVRVGNQCLECHQSALTGDIPGHILRSVRVLADGQTDLTAGSFLTTDASPIDQRWGGWYVTGTHGAMRHMGNQAPGENGEAPDSSKCANVSDLSAFIDTKPYLSPHSDIVALMVLGHQTHLHNLITKAGLEARRALEEEANVNRELHRPESERLQVTTRRIADATEPLVRGLLFVGEAPLTSPVKGTTSFASDFMARGPRDKQGRSLRDFDLQRRLMRYPCSYLIYSQAFDGLPAPVKEVIYRRLREILTGKDHSPEFSHLSAADRAAILQILDETLPAFKTHGNRSAQ